MNIDILGALLVVAAPSPAAESGQPRLCTTGLRGSAHLAYKAYGQPLYGSDGLTCASVKAGAEARGRTAVPRNGRGQPPAPTARTFSNSVEIGP